MSMEEEKEWARKEALKIKEGVKSIASGVKAKLAEKIAEARARREVERLRQSELRKVYAESYNSQSIREARKAGRKAASFSAKKKYAKPDAVFGGDIFGGGKNVYGSSPFGSGFGPAKKKRKGGGMFDML